VRPAFFALCERPCTLHTIENRDFEAGTGDALNYMKLFARPAQIG
jgi:hypothetical protein